ncbi:Lipopolysaccharide biosynthesis protein [Rhodovastum atsumiense]|uniref:Lipopolysaccharide biosynthesis protein n=1 Tax=Rhodovastum atsumiense TaxID=504468 RepID=A0A5M6IZV9_9PROT|nr:lipopolysaccharide biosynthesis protein [Rhodovastum atsumiense]KAA5613880.1 lipopolysaccharide biosynthesis protein [Rhodovastum atsumiense]CAH2602004.1 Lipopolysaccharide biosynthesis protein [Rhodovastum atsumiense]
MQNVREKLGKGAIWLGASRVLINAVSILGSILLARLLVPEDFGLVAIANTLFVLLISATELPLGLALIQHKDPQPGHYHSAWTLGLARGGLIALICVAVAWPVAGIYGDARLIHVMLALGLVALLNGATNPRMVVFTRQLVFWQEFAVSVASKLASFSVSLGLAWAWQSYWALIGGILASQLAGLILSYVLVPFRPRLCVSHVRELWSFSAWVSLSRLMNTLNWKFDHLLVGGWLGQRALGLYSVADNLAATPTNEMIRPITLTLFPGFVQVAGDPARLRAAYRSAQSLVCAVAMPTGIGFALIAEPFVRIGMGEKWLPIVPIIQVLSTSFACYSLASTTAEPLAMAMSATKQLFQRDLVIFLTRIPLIVIGMATLGLAGVLVARLTSGCISMALNLHLVRSLIGTPIREQLRANIRTVASAALMAIAVLQYNRMVAALSGHGLLIELLAPIACGAAVYLGIHAGLWMLAGRPDGPETEVARLAGAVLRRLRPERLTIAARPAD